MLDLGMNFLRCSLTFGPLWSQCVLMGARECECVFKQVRCVFYFKSVHLFPNCMLIDLFVKA